MQKANRDGQSGRGSSGREGAEEGAARWEQCICKESDIWSCHKGNMCVRGSHCVCDCVCRGQNACVCAGVCLLGFKSQQDVTSLHSICITMTTRRQQQQRYATATAPFTLPLPLATLPSLSCLLHTPLPASLALLTVCCSSARYFYHFRFLQPDTFFALLHFALFFASTHTDDRHTQTQQHTQSANTAETVTHTHRVRETP